MSALLLIILFLPLAGALLLHGNRQWMQIGALVVTVAVLVLTAVVVVRFPIDCGSELIGDFDVRWLDRAETTVDVRFHVALDGLSLWLFALTSLLSVVAVLVSWNVILERTSLYYRLLLILETGLLGVFTARDIVLFYVFFEFTLIPLFFLIGLWGGQDRRRAAVKFFLFTLAGSVLTFLGLLAIVLWNWYSSDAFPPARVLTFSIPELTESLRLSPMNPTLQVWVFCALFAGFAIKTPLFPLHTWLPLAHVEAPTAGSVILAGVLLKVGTYGFARFSVPMLPQATALLMPWLLWIALAGIIYGALVALAQSDIKRLVAYSSVSHLGFCMLGLFAVNKLSVQGSVLQMVNHGLATGGLFAVVGMIYQRFHTREIGDFGGLARRMPVLTSFALVLTLSSIALPGLAGFAGEFPLLMGVFQRGWSGPAAAHSTQLQTIAVLSLGGVVLGAWYMLWMFQRVFFGPPQGVAADSSRAHAGETASSESEEQQTHGSVGDLSPHEIVCLLLVTVPIFWIGLQPAFFFNRIAPTLDDLMKPALQAADEGKLTDAAKGAPGHAKPQAAGGGREPHDGRSDAIESASSNLKSPISDLKFEIAVPDSRISSLKSSVLCP
jgi:NADH-quinone oxidoreductase subunit M